MSPEDAAFVRQCIALGFIKSPCLELGAGQPNNSRTEIEAAGIQYIGTDILTGPDVAFSANFENADEVAQAAEGRSFNSALVMNVLEHTFDPIRVLDNVFSLLNTGAACAITTPVVWPLHDFPMDCYRLNPNFYEQYAKRRGVELVGPFDYIGVAPVRECRDADGTYMLPLPSKSRLKLTYSRVLHRLLHTTGRGTLFSSHLSIGAVLRK